MKTSVFPSFLFISGFRNRNYFSIRICICGLIRSFSFKPDFIIISQVRRSRDADRQTDLRVAPSAPVRVNECDQLIHVLVKAPPPPVFVQQAVQACRDRQRDL